MVIVISGPIASGKSTLALELARQLEPTEGRVAVVDLDVVHAMLTAGGAVSDDATWQLARHAAATIARTFIDEGVGVVIAEGSFNRPGDRAALATHLGDGSSVRLWVTLHVSFEEALRRAGGDTSRGLSRDPDFLGGYYVAFNRAAEVVADADLIIDTERTTVAAAAAAIVAQLRRAAAH